MARAVFHNSVVVYGTVVASAIIKIISLTSSIHRKYGRCVLEINMLKLSD